ncbi:Ribonuclease H1, partial [Stegodyphus mimosarum]
MQSKVCKCFKRWNLRFAVYETVVFVFKGISNHSNINMPKPGFYAVKSGRIPGVYLTWAECEAQVKGYPNAVFKKFVTHELAEQFVGCTPGSIAKNNVNILNTTSKSSSITFSGIHHLNLNPSVSSTVLASTSDSTNNPPPTLIHPPSKRSRQCYYAVHRGKRPGVYHTWTECEAQIRDFQNASYRKFDNEEEALDYVRTGGIVKASKREIRNIHYNNRVIKRTRSENKDCEYILANPDECVVIFTDGASAQNGKVRARAGIGVYWGPNHPLNTSKRLSGRQTNNRAEIHAAIHALRQANLIGAKKVKLYTDSQFLIHAITDWIKKWKSNGWKLVNGDPVVNKDDFIDLESACENLDIEWIFVKAHARNHGNDEADRLAVAGSKLLLEPSNCSSLIKSSSDISEEQDGEPFILSSASNADEIPALIVPNVEPLKKPYYAVHKGKCPGVYSTWTECEAQIKDFPKPWFRKFWSKEEAHEFVKTGKISTEIKLPECKSDEYVTVFTDGASSCNGKEEARAGIGVYWGPGNKLNASMRLPGRQTNNRAEIYAAVHALRQAKLLGIKNLRLYTDSQFVIKGITTWIEKWKQNGWILANGKPVVNKEDFIALDYARQGLNVDWCYVKGHANNPGNVEADKLAVEGCDKP